MQKKQRMKMIYLDNAATTALDEKCLDIIREYNVERFYNPSALYRKAMESANAIKQARNSIAKSLGVKGEEIIFTASGSEADNIALLCSVRAKSGKVIIGSSEHSAVYNTALELKVRGYDVVFAPCDKYGRTDVGQLEKLIDNTVVLVSVMHVCNETGALNDLSAISKIIKAIKDKTLSSVDHENNKIKELITPYYNETIKQIEPNISIQQKNIYMNISATFNRDISLFAQLLVEFYDDLTSHQNIFETTQENEQISEATQVTSEQSNQQERKVVNLLLAPSLFHKEQAQLHRVQLKILMLTLLVLKIINIQPKC